jgi:Transposase IS116/IS110/IS902 family
VGLTEVEPDLSRFGNATAFVSRLGLCPDKRISGGKVLSTKTRKVKNRVAIVLRLGAKSLSRAKDHFLRFSAECEPGSALLRLSPQPCTSSHASSTTSYTPKNPTQNEPKCAFVNKPQNSA